MIPSLSGGIYKFDGDSIEAIPVTAEDLLKSSFKFTDDIVISGGKDVRQYGVNARTGDIAYESGMSSSKNKNLTDQLEEANDDILILKRQTQTVRAIEPRTGQERWNFSIGHHELELLPSQSCQNQKIEDKNMLQLDLRVIVPDGIICGYDKNSPDKVLWKQKFDAPIVSVFRMDSNNQLYSVDLFKNVQWLWQRHDFLKQSIDSKQSPSVYLGMYQQQLYIQESEFMRASVENQKLIENNLTGDTDKLLKIPFKPYPASNTALVTYEPGPNDDDEEEIVEKSQIVMEVGDKLNAQSVLHASQYAEGKGFYFFIPKEYNKTLQCGKKTRSTKITSEEHDNVTFKHHGIIARTSSLWDYWKEISVIALTTAFVINVMLNNRRKQEAEVVYVTVPYGTDAIDYDEEHKRMKHEILNEEQNKMRSVSESGQVLVREDSNYISRFLTDFDLVQCLGKGGFGVVFEVKNKLDDCNYAIKRILLPSKTESRERVMREVKTLANCEHKNIVRYFHAWVEQPPLGWQELKDKELLSRDILSTSITIDSPSPTEESKAFAHHTNHSLTSASPWQRNLPGNSTFNDFSVGNFNHKSFTDDTSSFIQFRAESQDENDVTEDENGEEVVQKVEASDDSFEIEFKNSTRTSLSEASDNSHVISFNASDSSPSNKPLELVKKGHRRQLSLDLPLAPANDPKLNKLSRSTGAVNQKMYLYIQMQLCMKNSLKDWLRANPIALRSGKIFDIWNQIIDAVHYVHLKGLIHRDLKPSNIFFALDGQIKIGDFGLVTDMAEIPYDPSTSSSSSSSFGDFDITNISQKKHTQRVGTSLYMSPEQSSGRPYNYKVDIFSLGLILFELLNYFNTETERFKVLDSIRKGNFPKEFAENFQQEVSRESQICKLSKSSPIPFVLA